MLTACSSIKNIEYKNKAYGIENELINASKKGDVDKTLLILYGNIEDVNVKDIGGRTALSFAAMNGHDNICDILIGAEAIIDGADNNSFTPLMYAIKENRASTVELLLGYSNLPISIQFLKRAFVSSNEEILKIFVNFMIDLPLNDEDKASLFMLVVWKGSIDLCNLLINRSFNINLAGSFGVTPLMRASGSGYVDIVELLLRNRADVNSVDSFGNSALMMAAEVGNIEICDLLLKAGANINNVNLVNITALILSAKFGHKNTYDFLIQNGADITIKDEVDKTASIYLQEFLSIEEDEEFKKEKKI